MLRKKGGGRVWVGLGCGKGKEYTIFKENKKEKKCSKKIINKK